MPALLAMVAALLLLSAGPALSGDFAGTLPNHSHVFVGDAPTPHSHAFDPERTSSDNAVNISSNDAGFAAVGLISPPEPESLSSADAAPWLHFHAEAGLVPDGLSIPPPDQPPVSWTVL